jgi:hypothetical protein
VTQPLGTNAGVPAPPAVEVRSQDGELLKRIALGAPEKLVALGWGEWKRTGRRRYMKLTSAPLSTLHSWRGRDGTRPTRADGSLKSAPGQLLGDPTKVREFYQKGKFRNRVAIINAACRQLRGVNTLSAPSGSDQRTPSIVLWTPNQSPRFLNNMLPS